MIVDTSAIVALLQQQRPHAARVAAALAGARNPVMSAPTVAECLIVLSYAAAQLSHEPLLAVGNDFTQTDLEFGGGVVGYWPTPDTAN